MINLYKSGNDHIPHHSDDESEIDEDSVILTISLGAERTIEFADQSSKLPVDTLCLQHGSVFTMTKISQNHYSHSILKDPNCDSKRLSVTLRFIKPKFIPAATESINDVMLNEDILNDHDSDNNCADVLLDPYDKEPFFSRPHIHSTSSMKQPSPQVDTSSLVEGYQPQENYPKPHTNHSQKFTRHQHMYPKHTTDTLYISSSMFRHLDSNKLSTNQNTAKVLFYPGCNSFEMLKNLRNDIEFKKIYKNRVKQVFLLTGTNYVDAIHDNHIPFNEATHYINELTYFLWSTFKNAKVSVLNILPRGNYQKNAIVEALNVEIGNMCLRHGLYYIDTEASNLFINQDGMRKAEFFAKGYDNVHLNKLGIIRLGKLLKYLAHHA